MHVLTKNQILRYVVALSKLTVTKINKAYVQENELEKRNFTKCKFIGFTNESFEVKIEAIYECNYTTRNGKDKMLVLYVGWNGNFVAYIK